MKMKSQRKLERERIQRESVRRARPAAPASKDDPADVELDDALEPHVARSVLGYDE
jgi:hypothetical protein